jgi:hypothetical protein
MPKQVDIRSASDPAESDKLDPRHKMAMDAIGFLYQMLAQHRQQFEALLKAESDMHSFGGIIDPTLYRDMLYSKSFKQQLRLVRAALKFLDETEAVKAELETQE